MSIGLSRCVWKNYLVFGREEVENDFSIPFDFVDEWLPGIVRLISCGLRRFTTPGYVVFD